MCGDIIENVYSNVSADCWDYSNIINEFDNYQNYYPEALWCVDINRKYIRPFINNPVDGSIPRVNEDKVPTPNVTFLRDRMQGRKKYQRRQWVKDQYYYFGTKYNSGDIRQKNFIYCRFHSPEGETVINPNFDLIIYPYSDMYITVLYDSAATSIKAKSNQFHRVGEDANEVPKTKFISHYYELINGEYVLTQDTAVNPEKTYYSKGYTISKSSALELDAKICCASRIQEIDGFASCYSSVNDFSSATKLKRLVIGSDVEGYRNTFTDSLTLGNKPILEELDIRGCSSLSGTLTLSSYTNLKRLYASGTNVKGVLFANGGKLQYASLPDSVATLSMRNLYNLTSNNFVCDVSNVKELTLQNGNLDNLALVTTMMFEPVDEPVQANLYNYYELKSNGECVKTRDIEIDNSKTYCIVRSNRLGVQWYDINCDMTTTDLLNQIYILLSSTLTGTINITTAITQSEKDKFVGAVNGKWKGSLTINGEVIPQYSLTFLNEDLTAVKDINNINYVQWVNAGQRPINPITAGYVITPTKASTAQEEFTFDHWSAYVNGEVSDGAFSFDQVVQSNLVLVAVFTSSPRKYTVTWWTAPVTSGTTSCVWNSVLGTNKQVLYSDSNVEYGSEVTFDNFTKVYAFESGSDITFVEAYNFMGWNKSTGFITGDTDVYAIWDYAKIQKDSNGDLILNNSSTLQPKTLSEMSSAEVAALAATTNPNNYDISVCADWFEDRDYFDVTLGHDFSFSNVEEDVLVELGNELILDGVTAQFPQDSQGNPRLIKLFSADAPSFTMAIDFQYTNDINGYAPNATNSATNQPHTDKTLFSCFENPDNGNDGFRVKYYSSGSTVKPDLIWGDKSAYVGFQLMRDMLVIRHIKGDSNLYVYSFNGNTTQSNGYSNSLYTTTLNRNTYANTDAPFVFGGIAEYDSENDTYIPTTDSKYIGSGIIHWCKIWYADLGDTVAKEIACWTRDKERFEYYENNYDSSGTVKSSQYVLSGTQNTRASASFISNNLLRYQHQMHSGNTNVGGWGGSEMYTFCQQRYFKALPYEWQNLIAQVKVPSTVGNKSSEVANYDSYIYLPSYGEVFGTNSEGTSISWLTPTNARRLAFRDVITIHPTANTPGSLTVAGAAVHTGANEPIFGQSKGLYSIDNPNGVREFDIWQNGSNTGYIFLSASTMAKTGYSGTNITQGNTLLGCWFSADYWFTRSPNTGYTNLYWCCQSSGQSHHLYTATSWLGVRTGFSIHLNLTQPE